LSDRPPDPAEGAQPSYDLPSAYDPVVPSRPYDDELDHDDELPAVTLHDRDAEVVTEPAVVAEVVAADTIGPEVGGTPNGAVSDAELGATGLSRRELREQREREESEAKQRRRGPKRVRSRGAQWTRRHIALALGVLGVPVGGSFVD
jgi:hypothetical protein